MPRDKSENHEKIIQAAFQEFMEFGYDRASMRRIGERCGLTAAALYRHFDSKEAMYDELVRSAVDDLRSWIYRHVTNSEAAIAGNSSGHMEGLWQSTGIDMMRELIYPRMPEYELLINKSHGTRYENFLSDLTDEFTRMMMPYLNELRDIGYNVRDISEKELHMLVTSYCAAMFEPVIHHYSLEEAVKYLDTVEAFFMPGWRNLLGF